MFRHMAMLCMGVFFCSTAVIFIKVSTVHPALLAGWRLLFATVLLLPWFLCSWRKHRNIYGWDQLQSSMIGGVLLAIHFISWAFGARETLAVNASLIVNMVPAVMPFLLWLLASEHVNRREISGTLIAMSGVSLLVVSDYVWNPDNVPGDALCFASMWVLATYMVWARRNRAFPDVWLYVVPLYFVASMVSFSAAVTISSLGIQPITWHHTSREYLILLGLAAMPTVLGHSLLNRSLVYLRGQLVGVFNLGQCLFAGILGWVVFRETPQTMFFPAALCVVAGALVIMGYKR